VEGGIGEGEEEEEEEKGTEEEEGPFNKNIFE
jgi:hypothetical protein